MKTPGWDDAVFRVRWAMMYTWTQTMLLTASSPETPWCWHTGKSGRSRSVGEGSGGAVKGAYTLPALGYFRFQRITHGGTMRENKIDMLIQIFLVWKYFHLFFPSTQRIAELIIGVDVKGLGWVEERSDSYYRQFEGGLDGSLRKIKPFI